MGRKIFIFLLGFFVSYIFANSSTTSFTTRLTDIRKALNNGKYSAISDTINLSNYSYGKQFQIEDLNNCQLIVSGNRELFKSKIFLSNLNNCNLTFRHIIFKDMDEIILLKDDLVNCEIKFENCTFLNIKNLTNKNHGQKIEFFASIFKDIKYFGNEEILLAKKNLIDNSFKEVRLKSRKNLFGEADLDSNYIPIWTDTLKSLCIDNGLEGKRYYDPDMTRNDIGAKFFSHPNGYLNKKLYYNNPETKNKYYFNWVSFPVLDTLKTKEETVVEVLDQADLTNIIHKVFERIFFKPNPDLSPKNCLSIDWMGQEINQGARRIFPWQGFIIRLNEKTKTHQMRMSGFQTPPDTKIPLRHGWNWIGYFLPESMNVLDALENILPNLKEIQHHDYFYLKNQNKWLGIEKDYAPTINFGDMIKVFYTGKDTAFSWNYDSKKVRKQKLKKPASQFIYAESYHYKSVLIDLGESYGEFEEIAIFVDGVCHGAERVISQQVPLRFYMHGIDNLKKNNVKIFYVKKGENKFQKIENYKVSNLKTDKFEKIEMDLLSRDRYYYLKR